MNKSWSRWIRASIYKHFEDRKGSVSLYFEGMERQQEPRDLAELRFDGPYAREISKDVWEITVEINALVQCLLDKDDLYKIDKILGIISTAFTKTITVFKYGNDTETDDQTVLGCLQILVSHTDGDGIVISRFGVIEPDVELEHVSIEAHYKMRLVL